MAEVKEKPQADNAKPQKAKVLAHIRHNGKTYEPGEQFPLQNIPDKKVEQLFNDGFLQRP
jgi:hypothetical protein